MTTNTDTDAQLTAAEQIPIFVNRRKLALDNPHLPGAQLRDKAGLARPEWHLLQPRGAGDPRRRTRVSARQRCRRPLRADARPTIPRREDRRMRRLVVPVDRGDQIRDRLFAAAPLENGCFCLLRQGLGVRGTRLLVGEPLLPPEEDAWDT